MICHNGRVLAWSVRRCESFRARSRGMLGVRCTERHQAWRLRACSAVHSIGMREAIDLAFCAAGGRVVRVVENLPPWRIRWQPGSRCVWEFPAGAVRELGLRSGDWLMALDARPIGRRRAP